MKTLPLIGLSLVLASAGFSTAHADTLRYGNYTVDFTSTGGMTAVAVGGGIAFSHERVDGVTPGSVSRTGSMTATFTADAGLIFDRFNFGGLSGGITAIETGGARAQINWQVNGGVFSGPATYGGANSVGFAREWEITGATTGTSQLYGGLWFLTRIWDFSNPVYGSGYYNIGASSFSVNLDSSIHVTDSGSWASFIVPSAVNFGATLVAAPPAGSAVPDAASTMGLMLLALVGMVGVRRRVHTSHRPA